MGLGAPTIDNQWGDTTWHKLIFFFFFFFFANCKPPWKHVSPFKEIKECGHSGCLTQATEISNASPKYWREVLRCVVGVIKLHLNVLKRSEVMTNFWAHRAMVIISDCWTYCRVWSILRIALGKVWSKGKRGELTFNLLSANVSLKQCRSNCVVEMGLNNGTIN